MCLDRLDNRTLSVVEGQSNVAGAPGVDRWLARKLGEISIIALLINTATGLRSLA